MPNRRRARHIEPWRFDPSLRQLVHELNSMLDGSIRCISIAQKALAAASDSQSREQAIQRLDSAQQALQSMAELLERALRGEAVMHDDARPLGEHVKHIISACSAMAEQAAVRMDLHMTDAAAALPSGPLGAVVLNGVRNAIEACTMADTDGRQVEISIGINCRNQLELIIADTGPGVGMAGEQAKRGGHGIGLDLCRQLAASVGGTVELMNVPFGGGAVLRVLIPVRKLQRT